MVSFRVRHETLPDFLLITFVDKLGWNDGQASAFAEAVVQ